MPGSWSLVGIGLLGLSAASGMLAQSKTGNQPKGDVFSSRGEPDDRRKYVSPDGRSFDRCAYETAHMADNPYTRLHGMPDHIPIDVEVMRQYVRCAVDSCAPDRAVCWGKKGRETPVKPTSPDSFNSNGYSNCQPDGMVVVCDPPTKLLPILPAVCLADNMVLCETKVVFKLYAKSDTAKMTGYYDNIGKTVGPLYGDTIYKGTTIFVDIRQKIGVGTVLDGPLKVLSAPLRYSRAVGSIDPSTTNVLVITQLKDLSGNEALAEYETIRVYLRDGFRPPPKK